MNYSKERKEKNEKAYSEICDLTKQINDMAKDAVIETLKECDNKMLALSTDQNEAVFSLCPREDCALWGTDTDSNMVQVTFISLGEDGKVHYNGEYLDSRVECSGVINEDDDMVSFDWADVLFCVNAACDFVPEYL